MMKMETTMFIRSETPRENDRAWFESHPERQFRLRLPEPGERDELGNPHEGMVLVRQLKPGFRVRRAIPFPMLLPPSVLDGRVLTEPEVIRLPASEIYGA